MITFRDALRAHQHQLNRLNVYPVPDGDTGTNMALTLEAVAKELDALDSRLDGAAGMGAVCRAMAHGSLMGARGNSGVILSQLLRGLADRLGAKDHAGAETLSDGLVTASDLAYKAVARPVEGTILTVARAAGEGAAAGVAAGAGLLGVVERARAAAGEALAKTPTMLHAQPRRQPTFRSWPMSVASSVSRTRNTRVGTISTPPMICASTATKSKGRCGHRMTRAAMRRLPR